jgi:hypothetical protein
MQKKRYQQQRHTLMCVQTNNETYKTENQIHFRCLRKYYTDQQENSHQGGEHSVETNSENQTTKSLQAYTFRRNICIYFSIVETKISEIREFSESSPA